jgi:uracil-DNA glycosylase
VKSSGRKASGRKSSGRKASVATASDSFDQHFLQLRACAACPNVEGHSVTGYVRDARVILVGQAPGPHELVDRKPFAYTAGKRLFGWFAEIGAAEEQFRQRVHIAAVIRCFPGKDRNGGDRVPDAEEIARCGPHLDREISILRPELVIAVGTLAARQLVGSSVLDSVVGHRHRVERAGRIFEVIVLPHPSGRSTWINKPANAALLRQSLRLIAAHPAWNESVLGTAIVRAR